MNLETKMFTGVMDTENSVDTVSMENHIHALNVRNLLTEGGSANILTNLEGNELIRTSLPAGQSRVIGSQKFDVQNRIYFVRYNSMGYHQIVEYDYKNKKHKVFLENLTDTNGKDVFNISSNDYISDIDIIGDRFLILNSGTTEIMFLDLEEINELKRNGGVITKEHTLLIQKPPTLEPKVAYYSDSTMTVNSLRGSLFQFIYQYEYSGNRTSSWGAVSQRIVPENESEDGFGQQVGLYNVLEVNLDAGDDRVKAINIAVRIGNGEWLRVKTVLKEYVKSLEYAEISKYVRNNITYISKDNSESYDPITNTYSFLFYNDGMYPLEDQVEVNNPYDAIPQKAETVAVVNGNLVAVGGGTEGYDRPVIENVQIGTSVYSPNIGSSVIGGSDFDVDKVKVIDINPSFFFHQYFFYFKGSPRVGDSIRIKVVRVGDNSVMIDASYVVKLSEEGDLKEVLKNFAEDNPKFWYESLTDGTPLLSYLVEGTRNPSEEGKLSIFSVSRADIGGASTKSINTLKSGSSYQLALFHYDEFGRRFPIVTDNRFIVNTPSIVDTIINGKPTLTQINWTLNGKAPKGAKTYSWGITENQKYQKSIYLTGIYESDDDKYITFDLKSLERLSRDERDSQVNYEFTTGDRVTLLYTTSGENNTPITVFRYPFIDLDIVNFEVKIIEPETPSGDKEVKYLLKVRKNSVLPISSIREDVEVLLELYTPKKRGVNTEGLVFFETGQTYTIDDNGNYSVESGSISQGDWFYRGRLYESIAKDNVSIVYDVEDSNFSDNYVSNYWSTGRPRTYYDETGRVEKRKGSIRYSDLYIIGSYTNNINKFYIERIYGELGGQTTSKYGSIKKLIMRDNALMAIQENKVGVIPVYRSIIEDNNDQQIVADSGRIFGNIQYRQGGDYGCGDAKESIVMSQTGNIYFVDDNRGIVLVDTVGNGVSAITVLNDNFFINTIKKAKENNHRILGFVDSKNKEYLISINNSENQLITLDVEDSEIYDTDSVPLSTVTHSVNEGLFSLDKVTGIGTYTAPDDFIGKDVITLGYTNSQGVQVEKFINVDVIEGNTNPNMFTFGVKNNQELSTLVESVETTITGITKPSPISIDYGEYRINSEQWTSENGFIDNNSTLKVRHITSDETSTEKISTVKIGEVEGVFKTVTISGDVPPTNPYVIVTGEIEKDLIHENVYNAVFRLSENIKTQLTFNFTVSYIFYGSVYSKTMFVRVMTNEGTEVLLDIFDGQTPITSITEASIDVSSSSILDGTKVLCADDEMRILRIEPTMLLPF